MSDTTPKKPGPKPGSKNRKRGPTLTIEIETTEDKAAELFQLTQPHEGNPVADFLDDMKEDGYSTSVSISRIPSRMPVNLG